MYRALLLELHGKVKSAEHDLLSVVVPLLKLISLSVIGVLLANPKTKLVPKSTFKLLSKLVFALFLPCLIFTNLGQSITFKNFILWWFIPANVLISTLIGCLLGYLVAIICRPPPEFFRFTIIMTGFGNTGYLPLAIVSSICHYKENPFGSDCHTNGVAYVSFAQWVSVILVYTLVYHMMEPPREYYEIVEAGDEMEIEVSNSTSSLNDQSMPLLHEAEWPGIEDKETEHSKQPVIANVFFNSVSSSIHSIPDFDSIEEGRRSPWSFRCLAEPRVVKKMRIVAERTPIQHIFQPPTIASLLAIFVGMVPQIKSIVFGDDALLGFATDSLEIMAKAMVPSAMLILGGMLAEGPTDCKLGRRTTIGIIVARLLVLPLVGIGVVLLADKLNLLVQDDQMYRFVLLLQYTTPSAILLGAIASLRGYAVREASALIFWQHILAVISISVYIIIYFRAVLSYV